MPTSRRPESSGPQGWGRRTGALQGRVVGILVGPEGKRESSAARGNWGNLESTPEKGHPIKE